MQDYANSDYDQPAEGLSKITKLKAVVSAVAGAVIAVSLLLAIGVWFYRLGARDAQNVPIIRASLEPAKERPVDPGGLITAHQDVTSYEVAESEPIQATAAVIAPEPPKPDREDIAMSVLAEVQAQEQAELARAAVIQTASETTAPVSAPTPQRERVATPATTTVSAEPETEATADEALVEVEPEPVMSGTDLAPSRSPVAPIRPRDLVARSQEAAREAEESADNLVQLAARSAVQVQLAADPSETYIRKRWKEIYRANDDVLRGRTLSVQSTISGGKTFYRLRVGPFENTSQARSVCQALKARGQDCIVARNS